MRRPSKKRQLLEKVDWQEILLELVCYLDDQFFRGRAAGIPTIVTQKEIQ
jgi:hypothetical protein